jgi:hypothetical protein
MSSPAGFTAPAHSTLDCARWILFDETIEWVNADEEPSLLLARAVSSNPGQPNQKQRHQDEQKFERSVSSVR